MKLLLFVMWHSEEPEAFGTISCSSGQRCLGLSRCPGSCREHCAEQGRAVVLARLWCLTAHSGPAAKGLPAQALCEQTNKKAGAVGVECPHSSLSWKLKLFVCIIHVLETWLAAPWWRHIPTGLDRSLGHSPASGPHKNTASPATLSSWGTEL